MTPMTQKVYPEVQENLEGFLQVIPTYLGNLAQVKTIVEIGARDCAESKALLKACPKAHLYAFECNPDTLPRCREAVQSEPRIILVEKAVSERNGDVTFFKIDTGKTETPWPDGNPGASSLFQAAPDYAPEKYVQEKTTVTSIRLDSFFKENEVWSIDILWMDIQGGELGALKSAGSLLKTIKVIETEVEFKRIYKDQPLFADIKKYLNSNGFLLVGFNGFGHHSGNAVFVNKSILNPRQILLATIKDKSVFFFEKVLGKGKAINYYAKRIVRP